MESTSMLVIIGIGVFFVVGAAIAHGVNEFLKLTDRLKAKPPVTEQISDVEEWANSTFARKAELAALEKRFDDRSTLDQQRHAENVAAINGVHDRLDPWVEKMGHLSGLIEAIARGGKSP